jgi:1-phosphofructokinase
MIVTVTPNPSIDRTITLAGPLTRGAVHRVESVSTEPGGKGVNVARALTMAGLDTVALFPENVAVRTNIAVTEPDGTTTKLNERGAALDTAAVEGLTQAVLDAAASADWVVLSGSLPPGVPRTWYADMVAMLVTLGCRIAVDTSDEPLAALAAAFERAAPDLIKPNSDELASMTGASAAELEYAVAQGNPEPMVAAARQLVDRGARSVLATLGAAGAVLVDQTGSWLATPPPITPISTVGAGDASLAGYLRAETAGAAAPERLRMAVAYGSAAASLPGSALPTPEQVELDAVRVRSIAPSPPTDPTKVSLCPTHQ